MNILIVEDDPLTLLLLKKTLNNLLGSTISCNIITCNSATEALIEYEKIESTLMKIDIIFSDFMMDYGDGIDLLENVRKKTKVPFVFVTCIDKALIKPMINALSNVEFLNKPISKDLINSILLKYNIIDLNTLQNVA
jgi:two-component SAPR family response regulator